MSCLADQECKTTLRKSFNPLPGYKQVLYAIFGVFYCAYIAVLVEGLVTDPKSRKFRQLKKEGSFKNKIYRTGIIDFSQVSKCYKMYTENAHEKVTFNDYFMGILGVSFNKWFEQNGIIGGKSLKAVFPVNYRPLPTKPEEALIGNH